MKRNSRTENFQWTFEGISAAREFRRNIELLTAGEERETNTTRIWGGYGTITKLFNLLMSKHYE